MSHINQDIERTRRTGVSDILKKLNHEKSKRLSRYMHAIASSPTHPKARHSYMKLKRGSKNTPINNRLEIKYKQAKTNFMKANKRNILQQTYDKR